MARSGTGTPEGSATVRRSEAAPERSTSGGSANQGRFQEALGDLGGHGVLDGTDSQSHVCRVAASRGAVGQTLQVAIVFADLGEAPEEGVGVVEQVVDLAVQTVIQGGEYRSARLDGCRLAAE